MLRGVFSFEQLLEFFRVKEMNGPATCEQAPVVPVILYFDIATIVHFIIPDHWVCFHSAPMTDGSRACALRTASLRPTARVRTMASRCRSTIK